MTDGHLLPEQLAEHAEGLLTPADARAVDAHLQGCAQCRETVTALESVSRVLATAPRSLPTPPDIVARVDRALAAERAERSRQATTAGLLERFRGRLPMLAAAAAGVAVLGFAGWAVGSGALGGGSDDSATETVAEAPRQADHDAGAEAAPGEDSAASDGDAPADEQRPEEFGADAAPVPDEAALVDPAALEAQILAVTRSSDRAEGSDGCGARLAAEQQAALVGSARTQLGETEGTDEAVLVVLETDEPDVVRGWVLPSCDAVAADALAPALTVPVE